VAQLEPLLNLFTQGEWTFLTSRGPNSKWPSWSPCSSFSPRVSEHFSPAGVQIPSGPARASAY
jgi:hypothetical protein